ncbi:hypothetical protein E3Q10_03517 [Wallemia mellicola]|uniref:Calcofluor white hypersensitive protein n=1 Tax=Wallemia mellicola TaxID=1708541 RepID=A0A4T0QTG6_9BASI|nr:hypothetical protein E3Q10_03517 [Wallemia mellicola]
METSKPAANTHAMLGLVRTFSCGGFVYITSTDNGTIHDMRIAGAYTYYAFFEWGLIIADILFDSMSLFDLEDTHIYISDSSRGTVLNINNIPMGKDHRESEKVMLKEDIPAKTPREVNKMPNKYIKQSSKVIYLTFMADTMLSLVWWTNFTALPLCIFYYSVWSLSFAGQEGLMLVTLSAGLIGIEELALFASSRDGKTVLTLVSFLGLFASKLEFPVLKLVSVSMAVIAQSISIASDWYRSRDRQQVITFMLGLLLHSTLKLLAHSNNPFWPIVNDTNGGYIKTGLVMAFIALLIRRCYGSDYCTSPISTQKRSNRCLIIGASLGSYIWALHTFLSDPSTLLSWSWTGFPSNGPHPMYNSSMIIVGFAIGIMSPEYLAISNIWHLFGTCCITLCYICDDWLSASGAFGFSIYLPSLGPVMIWNIKHCAPGRTMLAVFGTYTLLIVAHTFTVAYEFVPLGFLLRERTHVVIFTALAFIWLTTSRTTFNITYGDNDKAFKRYTKLLLVGIICAAHFILLNRINNSVVPQPYHTQDGILTSGIWTVHFGMDDEMWDSQIRMRDLIREAEVDVLGLLETELQSVVFGNRNLAQFIAEDLGYYVDYGPPSHKHTWGAVLLSKFPIKESQHHLLPSPQGELAPAISAKLDLYGNIVNVLISHNGQEESPLDRELQTTEIARILNTTYPEPALFLGYLVTTPHQKRPAPYGILFEDGRMLDIEPLDRRRWCEYIGYRSMRKIAYARISHGTVTDTELQVAKFKLYDTDESYHPQFDWYTFMDEEHIPDSYRFSNAFAGKGKDGHRFHVFKIPIYYQEMSESD